MLRETRQDLVVRSSDFRVEKICLGASPLNCCFTFKNKKEEKFGDQLVKPKL